MKQIVQILITAGLLAGLACGCVPVPHDSENGDAVADQIDKCESIEVYDGDGNLLRTLSTDEELDTFWEALKFDDWEWADEPETRTAVEAAFVFTQRPTETVLGGKPAEDERVEVIRLTLYEGSDIAEERLAWITLHSVLPPEVLETLHGYCTPAA